MCLLPILLTIHTITGFEVLSMGYMQILSAINLIRNPAQDIWICRHKSEMLREPLLVQELAIHFEM